MYDPTLLVFIMHVCTLDLVHSHSSCLIHAVRSIMPKNRGYGWSMKGTKASRRQRQLQQRSSRFYAVAVGRRRGVFPTWDDAYAQVHRYSGAKHKSFKKLHDAFIYLHDNYEFPPGRIELWTHMRDTPRSPEVFHDTYLQYWDEREKAQDGTNDG